MTTLQKLQVEQSEKRQKVNELLALEEMTDEQRGELGTLTTRLQNLETELRAAIVVQGEEEERAAGMFGNGDGEAGERGRLLRETRATDYLAAAAAGVGLTGRAADCNAALDLPTVGSEGGIVVPWQMLEVRQADRQAVETRAFTTTANNDGGEVQRPILARLFGASVMSLLGVRLDSVAMGRQEVPIITSGVAPMQTKEAEPGAAPVASSFGMANLRPKKLVGSYSFTHEIARQVVDVEGALRRDLSSAVDAAMSHIALQGQEPTEANPERIEGFLASLTQVDDATEASADRYGALPAEATDGIHGFEEMHTMVVLGVESYKHSAAKYLAGAAESGSDLLKRRSGGILASVFVPPPTNAGIQSALLHAAGPNGGMVRGDSVGALWPLEMVRDPYSEAGRGVRLHWIAFWDLKVALRAQAYKLIGLKIA
ncbi:MAG: hypothetical protein OXC31_11105 [Spirochaetaceae bacterium]|nr:hypothetical protein [Spirochaetaceae bacterium]